jgi:hypothetical protein
MTLYSRIHYRQDGSVPTGSGEKVLSLNFTRVQLDSFPAPKKTSLGRAKDSLVTRFEAFPIIAIRCLFLSQADLCYSVARLGTEVIIMEGISQ